MEDYQDGWWLEHKAYKEKLGELHFFSVQRRVRGLLVLLSKMTRCNRRQAFSFSELLRKDKKQQTEVAISI